MPSPATIPAGRPRRDRRRRASEENLPQQGAGRAGGEGVRACGGGWVVVPLHRGPESYGWQGGAPGRDKVQLATVMAAGGIVFGFTQYAYRPARHTKRSRGAMQLPCTRCTEMQSSPLSPWQCPAPPPPSQCPAPPPNTPAHHSWHSSLTQHTRAWRATQPCRPSSWRDSRLWWWSLPAQ